MIITTTGNYGTGSSAITDLLKECENVSCKSDYEIRFLHDPDGIGDLEYHMFGDTNRHTTSHAIKSFLRAQKDLDQVWIFKRYRKYFGPKFMEYTNEYVNNIVSLSYNGSWHWDRYEKGHLYYVFTAILHRICLALPFHMNIMDALSRREVAYLGITDHEKFLDYTRQYVDKIALLLNPENKPYVVMDQLFPPSNFEKYLRFVNDVRVVLVERDPRDIFLLEKYIWKGNVVPKNVKDFCEWYKWTRSLYRRVELPEQVMLVQFEDLIFKYEETIAKVLQHCQIEQKAHVDQRKYFNPERSKMNTCLWNKFPEAKENIVFIEQDLKDYLYHFPQEEMHKEKNIRKIF